MKKLITLAVILVISIYSFNVSASDINYSYTDIGLSIIDNDGADAAGIAGQFSHAINEKFRLKLGAAYSEGLDVEFWIEDLVVTAGYILELKPQVDLVMDAGFIVEWFENNFFDDSDSSIYLTGEVRGRVDNNLELYAGLAYQSLFDDSDVAVNAGIVFSTDSKTSFGLNILSAEVSAITVFLRLYSN